MITGASAVVPRDTDPSVGHMAASNSAKHLVARANESIQLISSQNSFNKILKSVLITEFSDDRTKMKAQFVVAEEHLNRRGILHGGCTTTIVDMMTAYNCLGYAGDFSNFPGFSISLHVKFLKPAFEGDLVQVESNIIKMGRQIAFTRALLFKADQLIAYGQQTGTTSPGRRPK